MSAGFSAVIDRRYSKTLIPYIGLNEGTSSDYQTLSGRGVSPHPGAAGIRAGGLQSQSIFQPVGTKPDSPSGDPFDLYIPRFAGLRLCAASHPGEGVGGKTGGETRLQVQDQAGLYADP